MYQAIRDRNLRDHANFENVVGVVGNRMQIMDEHVQSLVRQNDALKERVEKMSKLVRHRENFETSTSDSRV